MAEEVRNDIIIRLKRIEGQVRGLQKMIEEGRDCVEIVNQLAAARRALDKVGFLLLTSRMEECVRQKAAGGKDTERALQDTMDLFLTLA